MYIKMTGGCLWVWDLNDSPFFLGGFLYFLNLKPSYFYGNLFFKKNSTSTSQFLSFSKIITCEIYILWKYGFF